jgi:hypothetical protein
MKSPCAPNAETPTEAFPGSPTVTIRSVTWPRGVSLVIAGRAAPSGRAAGDDQRSSTRHPYFPGETVAPPPAVPHGDLLVAHTGLTLDPMF